MANPTGDNAVDVDWENLISWLETYDPDIKKNLCVYSKIIPGAGRGLFVNKDVTPDTPLFSIPNAAHLNASTLAKLYIDSDNERKLSAVQLISLHLYIHRPDPQNNIEQANHHAYGPYLAILPRDFASHPLSWLASNVHSTFLACMPPTTLRNLHKRFDQFQQDWKVVSAYLNHLSQKSSELIPSSFATWKCTANKEEELERYLWAWLNVNTRCFYMLLCSSKTDPDNITLCPLADLANHSSLEQQATTKTPIPTFYSPLSSSLRKDDEIYLKYGSHSNSTLFTEYGFVEKGYPSGGQVDVQDIIEAQFEALGDLGMWMRSLLEDTNFWGDWFLYDFPSPASPSYRILPALRLLQLSDTLSRETMLASNPFSLSKDLQAWKDTIFGENEVVSQSNESAVWNCITSICELISTRARTGLQTLQKAHQPTSSAAPHEWQDYAVECIQQLWLEELHVAEAVIQTIKAGEL